MMNIFNFLKEKIKQTIGLFFKKIFILGLFVLGLTLAFPLWANHKSPSSLTNAEVKTHSHWQGKACAPVQYYLFFGGNYDNPLDYQKVNHRHWTGAQILFFWKTLEPKKGQYNFKPIDQALAKLNKIHKKLWITIQDRSFSAQQFPVPSYMAHNSVYANGATGEYSVSPGQKSKTVSGWVANVWNKNVQKQYALLMKALAAAYDGKIAGINSPETAIGFDEKTHPNGFTPKLYYQGELANITAMRQAFHKSLVVAYVNFMPGEWLPWQNKGYLEGLFQYIIHNHMGVGGPDLAPGLPGLTHNAYALIKKYKKQLPLVTIAFQQPDYAYKNPATGKKITIAQAVNFAVAHLGAKIIFWSAEEPEYTHYKQQILSVCPRPVTHPQ